MNRQSWGEGMLNIIYYVDYAVLINATTNTGLILINHVNFSV